MQLELEYKWNAVELEYKWNIECDYALECYSITTFIIGHAALCRSGKAMVCVCVCLSEVMMARLNNANPSLSLYGECVE